MQLVTNANSLRVNASPNYREKYGGANMIGRRYLKLVVQLVVIMNKLK